MKLVLGMLKVDDGPLDEGYSGKVTGLVSDWNVTSQSASNLTRG